MGKVLVCLVLCILAGAFRSGAVWAKDADVPRISELMEPATELIDQASDMAAEGKISEAVALYRKALLELDRIESANPDRAKTAEFATLRNKRAYVSAAVDSMLLTQVKANAKAVAVSETSGLERQLVLEAIEKKNFAMAERIVSGLLASDPDGELPLTLKAVLAAERGRIDEAKKTLLRLLSLNPRSHVAYYNMANLLLRTDPADKAEARRYYENGRAVGGSEDSRLEAKLK